MRYLTCFLLLFVFISEFNAQELEPSNESSRSDGFGGPVLKISSAGNQSAILFGGRGGWNIGKCISIGGGGYTIVSKVKSPAGVLPLEGPLNIDLTYFGFEIEYVTGRNMPLHFSFYNLTGFGNVRFVKDTGSLLRNSEQSGEGDIVFVLEPAANIEFIIDAWFRMSAGLSYRLLSGVNQPGIRSSELSGLSLNLSFKFGSF